MASFPRRYAVYIADLNPTMDAEIRRVSSMGDVVVTAAG